MVMRELTQSNFVELLCKASLQLQSASSEEQADLQSGSFASCCSVLRNVASTALLLLRTKAGSSIHGYLVCQFSSENGDHIFLTHLHRSFFSQRHFFFSRLTIPTACFLCACMGSPQILRLPPKALLLDQKVCLNCPQVVCPVCHSVTLSRISTSSTVTLLGEAGKNNGEMDGIRRTLQIIYTTQII